MTIWQMAAVPIKLRVATNLYLILTINILLILTFLIEEYQK